MVGTSTTSTLAKAVSAVSALRGSTLGWRGAILGARNRLPLSIDVGTMLVQFGFVWFGLVSLLVAEGDWDCEAGGI
jgi:hypothetical protein